MDIEKLVELATRAILNRLNADGAKVVTFGEIPDNLISSAALKAGKTFADVEGCDYIVMSAEAFYEIHGGKPAAASPEPQIIGADTAQKHIDLTGKRLIHERDLRDANAARDDIINVSKNAIITALASDYAKSVGAKFQKG